MQIDSTRLLSDKMPEEKKGIVFSNWQKVATKLEL